MNGIDTFIVRTDWAVKYGFEESAMLWWMVHWIKLNAHNEKNYHEGRTWTYNSRKNISELFPCWSEKQIWRIIESLITKGVLIKGNFNKTRYDRTNWFALSNELDFGVESHCPNGTMEHPENDNGLSGNAQPIPIFIPEKNKKKNKATSLPEQQRHVDLAIKLMNKIKEQGTEGRFKEDRDIPKWAKEFRLMEEIDKRENIGQKIDLVFSDSFWSQQIRSAKTFREKWALGRFDKIRPVVPVETVKPEEVVKCPWEEFVKGHGEPEMKTYQYLLNLIISVCPEWEVFDFLPETTWPSWGRVLKTAYIGVYEGKRLGDSKEECVHKMLDFFRFEKRAIDENEY